MTVEGEGRRDRKKSETRQALRDAAHRLFAEKGFSQTTIDDIAAAADVSRRTFFRYYDSKDDLLRSDVSDLLPVMLAALRGRPADTPLVRMGFNAPGDDAPSEEDRLRAVVIACAATSALRAAAQIYRGRYPGRGLGTARLLPIIEQAFAVLLDGAETSRSNPSGGTVPADSSRAPLNLPPLAGQYPRHPGPR